MRFQGALITEQDVTFAIAVVQPHVVGDQKKYEQLMPILEPIFPGVPIILMTINPQGVPIFYGRQDIVNFLTKVPIQTIPWRWYRTKEEENEKNKGQGNSATKT